MKANQHQLPVRNLTENLALVLFMIILLIVSFFQEAKAQTLTASGTDPYFPGRHRFSAGFITTYRGSSVPAPVMIGDVTYGISNRFSLGIVGGTTGTLSLVAAKVAANLYEYKKFRLLYRMSMIYYPERKGTFLFDQSNQNVMPWMLTMGFFDGEWRMKSGLRWAVGMGLLETHCIDGMMNFLFHSKGDEDGDLPFEFFNTVQTSLSIPLSKKFVLRPEAIMVFQGKKFVSGNEHKVAPLNIYLNLVYHF